MAKRPAGTPPGSPVPGTRRRAGAAPAPSDDAPANDDAPHADGTAVTPPAPAGGAVPTEDAPPVPGAADGAAAPDAPAADPGAAGDAAPAGRENRWGGGFIPLQPAAAPAVAMPMPMPEGVIHSADNRLDAVPFEFADIRALAQRILKRAQEQGQQKLDAARKQIAAMEKQAHDKGYKEAFEKGHEAGLAKGLKDGMAEADKKIAAAIASEKESLRQNVAPVSSTLKELADAITASRAQLQAQTEGDLLLLAIDLAKRLVGHELSVDPEAIKPLAMECIGLVTERTGITARVNPEDHRVMEEFYPDLKMAFPDLGPVQVVPDPSVERGGIHVATREAEVDMRLATRLAAFEEVILGFSGEEAVAPWSRIPPEAIAAARAANAVSPYSLDAAGDRDEDHPSPGREETPAEPAGHDQSGRDDAGEAAPPSREGTDAGRTDAAPPPTPTGEAVPVRQADAAEPPPDALPPADGASAGESSRGVEGVDEESDLADLVDFAAMVDVEGDAPPADAGKETP